MNIFLSEQLKKLRKGKGNTQEDSSGNLPEPHGLCHISEVLDYILSQNSK